MAQNYLLVNKQTGIVENEVFWDGNLETWSPPEIYTPFQQNTSPSCVWVYEETSNSYVTEDIVGGGAIGHTWDGQKFVPPKPEDLLPQPESTGLDQA